MATKSKGEKTGQSVGRLDSQLRAAANADPRSVNAIAHAARMDSSSLYRFMSSKKDLTLKHASRLAKALGLRLLPAREGDGDTIDDQLRAAIRADGRTLHAIGDASDFNPSHLPQFMAGKRGMKLAIAGRIAASLGLAFGPHGQTAPVVPKGTLDEQLRDALRNGDRSINAVALYARINPPNVYRFFSRKQDLKLDAAGRLAKALGLRLLPAREGVGDSIDDQLRAAIRADVRPVCTIAIAAGVSPGHLTRFMAGDFSMHLATASLVAAEVGLNFGPAELTASTYQPAKVQRRCPVKLNGEGRPILVYGRELPLMRGVAYAALKGIVEAFEHGGGCTPGELKGLTGSDRCLRLFIQAIKRPGFEPLKKVIPSWNAGKGKLFEIVDVRPNS